MPLRGYNEHMRLRVSLLALSIAVSLAMPLFVIAAAGSTVGANVAPSTPADAKACILKLFQAQNQQKAAAGEPSGATTDGIKDNCTSETINIAANGTKTITQTGRMGNNNLTNGCMVDSCSAPNCGTVTLIFNIPGLTAPAPISKCDPNYQKSLASASGNTAAATKNFALTAINQNAVQAAIQSGNPTTVANALQAFGVSSDEATDIATNHPADATNLLNAFATGNGASITSAVQAASENGVTLNQDTVSSITSLTPQQVSQNLSSQQLLTAQQQTSVNNIENAPDTFAAAAQSQSQALKGGANASMIAATEQQYNLPSGVLGNICQSESRCNPNVCYQNNPNSACGMYQYIPSTWTSTTAQMCAGGQIDASQCTANGSVPLSGRMDPTLSTQVAAYSVSQNLTQYGPLIAQTNIDQGTAAYIMQGLGAPEASKFFQAYIQNPNMSTADFLYQTSPSSAASIIANNGNLYNGQTLQGTVNQFSANMNSAPATNAPVGSAYTGIGSPFNAAGNVYSSSPLGANVTSPFGNVSPYGTSGIGGTSGYPIQYAQPAPQPIQYTQPVQTAPANTAPVTQTVPATTTASASSAQTGNAVAQIIAQPQSVSEGNPISVSWSSAGMSAASPCQVMENDTVIASGNGGSQVVTASSTGTFSFSLSCTAQGTGSTVTGSASVSVQ